MNAAINEIDWSKVTAAPLPGGPSSETNVLGSTRDAVRILLWQWIESHAEDRVRLHIWIFRKDFRIKELHRVFEILLGPRPFFTP